MAAQIGAGRAGCVQHVCVSIPVEVGGVHVLGGKQIDRDQSRGSKDAGSEVLVPKSKACETWTIRGHTNRKVGP